MRIPLSWLKDYISLNLTPSEIAQKLTMIGLEVDGFETIGEYLEGIVVCRVLEANKHPNADKLSVALVTDGKQTYQIVCGAPNCRAGMKTALAVVGTKLKDGDEVFTIKQTKLRGIDSCGMLCSEKELGLSEEHEGIIDLPDHLVEGTPLSSLYADTIFEISLTPNLTHCASIMGVARELAALIGLPLRYPEIAVKESDESIGDDLTVKVLDKENCPRYACRLIRDVKVGPSPEWMKIRLEKCGIRSINNVVDATNYVLMEMGHPLHAFDYDRIKNNEIIVRKANDGELLQTLDGKERTLNETMLVICDSTDPMAVAGVMGGQNSEVGDQTQTIVLEAAYFNPVSIRRTSKNLTLSTDASKRFERGTDPNQLEAVLNRTAQLIQEIAGGKTAKGIIDVIAKEFPEGIVTCRLSRINKVLGTFLGLSEVENIFKSLQFPTQWDGHDLFTVRIPTYRVDIKDEIDLIEEVARLYGYDNIIRQGGRYQSSSLPPSPIYAFEEIVRNRLIAEGLQEFLTCDLIGPWITQIVQDESMPAEMVIKVLNPVSIEQSILRTSLLPGLLQVVKYNVDHQIHDIAGFEIGRIHFRDGEQFKEQSIVGIVLTGKSRPSHWDEKPREFDYFDLKGIVENLLTELGVPEVQFKNLSLNTLHSGRQCSVFLGSSEIGSFGEIHPAIQRRLDVPQRIFFGEFNLQDIMKVIKQLEKVKPLAIYPSSERDWTLTVKESIPYSTLLELVQAESPPLVETVSLKDIYRSDKITPGYHNVTLHFVYRDQLKTVEQEVVETEHHRLIAAVLEKLGDAVKR